MNQTKCFQPVLLEGIDPFGVIATLVFVVGIIFAVVIHVRRLGIGPKAALIPISLLPFMIGVVGLCVVFIHFAHVACGWNDLSASTLLYVIGLILHNTALASLETCVLLVLTALLFLSKRQK